ncbi:MAG: endonuclease [Ferruginibacter sp.]
MVKNYFLFSFFTLSVFFSIGQGIPTGYYDAATGLSCQDLKTALSNIIATGQVQLVYGQLDDTQMPIVDTIRSDNGTGPIVWDIYSNNNGGPEPFTFNMAQSAAGGFCGATTPSVEGVCWNKEHTFPRSWFRLGSGGPYQQPTDADLFIVRPADSKINSRRASSPYSTVTSPSYQFPTPGMYAGYPMPPNMVLDKIGPSSAANITIPVAFEPNNYIKGDIARAYFYIMTRYENELSTWLSFNSGGGIEKVIDAANPVYPSLNIPYLQMLYNWHINDPVDAKEINRNNLVYSQQNNRNPYIDFPQYVNLVWQCTGVIPVTIIDFAAVKNTESVLLKWYATYETKFRQFNIERSINGTSFNKIGEVAGRNLANYTFSDYSLPNGSIVYYRLKMIDIDGKFTYSKTIAVRLNNNFSNALVYPNPTRGALTIKLLEALGSNSILQVTDVTGREVKQQNIPGGTLSISLNVNAFADGRYFIKIYNSTQLINESFVKLR